MNDEHAAVSYAQGGFNEQELLSAGNLDEHYFALPLANTLTRCCLKLQLQQFSVILNYLLPQFKQLICLLQYAFWLL